MKKFNIDPRSIPATESVKRKAPLKATIYVEDSEGCFNEWQKRKLNAGHPTLGLENWYIRQRD